MLILYSELANDNVVKIKVYTFLYIRSKVKVSDHHNKTCLNCYVIHVCG